MTRSLERISSFVIGSPLGIARRAATCAGVRIRALEAIVPSRREGIHQDDPGGLIRIAAGEELDDETAV